MNLQDLIAILIVIAAAFFAARKLWKTLNSAGCGSGCGKCGPIKLPNATEPATRVSQSGLIRTPLVTIGLPREAEATLHNKQ